MKQRTKRSHLLVNLIDDFENCNDKNAFCLTEERVIELVHYYQTEEEIDKALQVANLAIRKYEYQSEFYLLKARLLYYKKNYQHAISALSQAEILAPNELEVAVLFAFIYADLELHAKGLSKLESFKRSGNRNQQIRILLTEAYIFEHMKEFEKMFYTLRDTLTIDPDNIEALEKMWVSVEFSKLYEESIKFHLELIDRQPYSYLAWYNLGQAYACTTKYKKAIDALEYSFLINEEFEPAYRECAEICMQMRRYKKALSIYHDIISLFGIESEILVSISECHIHLNDYKKAKKILLKAVKQDPYNDEVFYLLGQCFAKENKWHYAVNAYQRALEIEDRREEYYVGIGKAFAKVGDWNQAQESFSKATEVGPEQNESWIAYIEFLVGIFQFEKALQIVEEADLNAVGVDLNYCKVVCLYHIGQREAAYELLAECMEEDFTQHKVLFEVSPDLINDKKINAMIDYYNEWKEL